MAQPGWYDDPDGTPGRLRYYDGTQWTPGTMLRPAAPQPAAPQPSPAPLSPPPGHVGQCQQSPLPGYGVGGPLPPSPAPQRRSPAVPIAVASVVLLLVVALAWAVPSILSSPGVPTSLPTTASVTTPTATASYHCPQSGDDTLLAGAVTVTLPPSWTKAEDPRFTWATCAMTADRSIGSDWSTWAIAIYLTDTDDWRTPQEMATSLWAWNAENNYGTSAGKVAATGSAIDKEGPLRAGGLLGYRITGEVSVLGQKKIKGDDVTVVVIQDDDGAYTALMTGSLIDDAKSAAEVAGIWHSLQVA